jgi:hypothetical protein
MLLASPWAFVVTDRGDWGDVGRQGAWLDRGCRCRPRTAIRRIRRPENALLPCARASLVWTFQPSPPRPPLRSCPFDVVSDTDFERTLWDIWYWPNLLGPLGIRPFRFYSGNRHPFWNNRSFGLRAPCEAQEAMTQECPLRVKGGPDGPKNRLPIFPQQRTSNVWAATSEKCQQRKWPTYSITPSARAKSFGGNSRFNFPAALRFMVSSNFVGCSIGISAALVPRKILSIMLAAR